MTLNKFPCYHQLITSAKRLSQSIKTPRFCSRLNLEFSVPRPRNIGPAGVEILWRNAGNFWLATRDFCQGFTLCRNFFGEFLFLCAFKTITILSRKKLCLPATQIRSPTMVPKILRYVLFRNTTWRWDEVDSAVVEHSTSNESLNEMAYMYADEPLADEEWLKMYNEEVKENEDLERMLQKRLDGTEHVDSWWVASCQVLRKCKQTWLLSCRYEMYYSRSQCKLHRAELSYSLTALL